MTIAHERKNKIRQHRGQLSLLTSFVLYPERQTRLTKLLPNFCGSVTGKDVSYRVVIDTEESLLTDKYGTGCKGLVANHAMTPVTTGRVNRKARMNSASH
jgi:hypothetical protein